MTVIVEVPGHGEVEFPDGMSEQEMEAAIRRNFMLPPKEAPKAQFKPIVDSLRKVTDYTPFGLAAKGMEKIGEFSEKVAYDAGGKVTDLTGYPELGFAANVGTQAIPTVVGAMTGKVADPAFKATGRWLMQNALKPSKLENASGKGARAAQTMLDEGVNVSSGGVGKLRSNINDLNDEIADIIKNSGERIDKNAVASRLNDVVKKWEDSIDPSDLKTVQDVWTTFLTHPKLAGNKDMAIQLAQKMKQIGGKKLEKSYGNANAPSEAETDSWKALVRGLKEEIAAAEPSVAPLNKRESDLINASKIAANRVAVDSNKNPLGLGALITQPWMVPVWMWDRSPLGKSLMARMLHSGNIPTAAGGAAGGLYGAEQGQDGGVLYRR